MMKIRIILLLLIPALFFALAPSRQKVPRNIVVMIGDGMGVSQVTAGRTYKGSLELDKFKTLGLVLTHAQGDDYTTDSAASATAFATGVETYNGAIAVGPDTTARKTVLERAHETRRKTGVVVACSITHATPASFVAHVASRDMELEIAQQISIGETDLYLGGGWGWFLPTAMRGRRTDGKDLLQVMQRRDYIYVSSDSAFKSLDLRRSKRILGLFAENHVGWAEERRPSLKEMTAAALTFLSRSNRGFFLMVEGSQIDWAGHDNNSDRILTEMADFDDAVGEVLRFSKKHPDTLVIVTADHETGGYSLVGGSLREKRVEARFVSTQHTGAMVPLFATGPGAERLGGIQTNSQVGRALLKLLQ